MNTARFVLRHPAVTFVYVLVRHSAQIAVVLALGVIAMFLLGDGHAETTLSLLLFAVVLFRLGVTCGETGLSKVTTLTKKEKP